MKNILSKSSALSIVIGLSVLMGCSGSEFGLANQGGSPSAPPPAAGSPPTEAPQAKPAILTPVTGQITDAGSGLPSVGLGGAGTVAAGKTVRILEILPGGVLKIVGEVVVGAAGAFTAQLALAGNAAPLVMQVVDAAGHVLASGILQASPNAAGQAIVAAPITTETSLEALSLVKMCTCINAGIAGINVIELRAIIDATLANSVGAAAALGVDVSAIVDAVAKSAVSAEAALRQSLAAAGVQVDVNVLLAAEASLAAKMDTALAAVSTGTLSSAQVAAQLAADLDAALKVAGVADAEVRALARLAASLTFQGTLSSLLAGVANADGVVQAAIRATAQLQAQTIATAVTALIASSGAAVATVEATAKAGDKLIADVANATGIEALKQARLAYVTAIAGTVQTTVTGVLGAVLQTAGGTVGGVLGTVTKLTAQLEADLKIALAAVVNLSACVGVDATATAAISATVQAIVTFTQGVTALAPQLGTLTPIQLKAVTGALGLINLLFRTL